MYNKQMQIEIIRSLEDADKATGLTVVIDVFRAFSTQAYIFANGADKIIPVLGLEEAHRLKKENPDYILIGERGGIKIEGFDYGNSPTEIINVDFTGKTIMHSTTNGTKGLINAINSEIILSGSFLIANSIIKYIKQNNFKIISFVCTSPSPAEDNEDVMLAYYIRDILNGNQVNESQIKESLRKTSAYDFLLGEAGVPKTDIELCLDFNKFNFIIKKVTEKNQMYLVRENI
jgi:2-phosphosulfolactate phosphatase